MPEIKNGERCSFSGDMLGGGTVAYGTRAISQGHLSRSVVGDR